MTPRRIGIVCHPGLGGSGTVATELAAALAERGHDVHLIARDRPFRYAGRGRLHVHAPQIPEHPATGTPPQLMAEAACLASLVEEHDLEILHAHFAVPHSMAIWMARAMCGRSGTRLITTLHGSDVTVFGAHPEFRRAVCFALGESDAVTSVSSWLAAEAARLLGCAVGARVIPNGTDTARFRPREDRNLRRRLAADDELLLGHASNMRPVKRVGDVVEVFARIAEQRPARLVMLGDGPDRQRAEEELERRGLGARALFLGAQEAPENVLPALDWLLLPSAGESFGLAALEAMACGVPVAGYLAGGLPEVVEDGVTGRLVGANDVVALAAAVQSTRDEAHMLMRNAARARVLEHFAMERIVPRWEALYEEVLASSS